MLIIIKWMFNAYKNSLDIAKGTHAFLPESFMHEFFSKGTFAILPKHFKTLTIKIMFSDIRAYILKIKNEISWNWLKSNSTLISMCD